MTTRQHRPRRRKFAFAPPIVFTGGYVPTAGLEVVGDDRECAGQCKTCGQRYEATVPAVTCDCCGDTSYGGLECVRCDTEWLVELRPIT